VTYYRLGRTAQAQSAFLAATRYPEIRAPAAYNLGRIARERGDTQAAMHWFERAAHSARTEAVRSQALAAKRALEPTQATGPWSGSVRLGLGYDSNVSLSPAQASGAARVGDTVVEPELDARYPLGNGRRLFIGLYAAQYATHGEFDYDRARVGYGARLSSDPWDVDVRGALTHERFNDAPFENTLSATGAGWRPVAGDRWLRLAGSIEAVRGAGGYGFLDGTTARLAAGIGGRFATGGRWRIDARVARTDRHDFSATNDFYSFSATSPGASFQVSGDLDPQDRVTAYLDAERSDYDGTEIRNGAPIGSRADRTLEIGLLASHRLDSRSRIRAEVSRTRRASTIDEFDYNRYLVHIGIEYEF